MLEIQTKLKLCVLLQPLTFKSLKLANNLQKFFIISDNDAFSFLKRPLNDQKQYISTAINLIAKPLSSGIDKIWVKLLFIDTLVTTCQSQRLTQELIQFMIDLCSDLNTSLNKIKHEKQVKDNSFTNKISTKIFKITSMINISSPLSRSHLTPTNSSRNITSPKSINKQQIIIKLLDSILSYQRKKLQLFDFIQSIKLKHQHNLPIITKDQTFENLVQNVWKIINLIKPHSIIVKNHKKISFMSEEYKPLMVAVFVCLCKDSLLLYPYIVKSIEIGAQNIKEKYDAIISQKLPKDIRKVRLQHLSRDIIFIQVDNLIQQLTSINETIFYLFCGKQHFIHLNLEIPKNFFLNTTNHKLDDIHSILKEVHQAAQKHQRSKLYISQMVQKLDQSVSKVVEKEKLKQSLTNIMRLEKCQEQDDDKNEQEFENGAKDRRRKRKNSFFFQQITQNI